MTWDKFGSYLFAVIVTIISFLAPVHAILASVFVLILADLFTGIWAAKKKKEKISSKNLKKTIVKLFVYECVIVMGFICQTYLVTILPLVSMTASVIGLVEFVSFLENVSTITDISFDTVIKRLRDGTSKDR